MIYRVHFTYELGTSNGYGFFGTRQEAERAIRQYVAETNREDAQGAIVDTIRETPRSKAGLLALLNRYGAHAENG